MERLEIAYLIANGGDGSASIQLFESKEFAEWYEDYSNEMGDETFSWGESSVGTIVVSSDSPITLEDKSIFTAKECFQKAFVVAALIENDSEKAADLAKRIKESFPESAVAPKVKIEPKQFGPYSWRPKDPPRFGYNIFYADDDPTLFITRSHSWSPITSEELSEIAEKIEAFEL